MGVAKHLHWRDEINSSLLVTYTHRPGRRMPQVVWGHRGAVLGNRVKQQGLWDTGFVVTRRWGAPWFPQEEVVGLFE